MTLYARSCERPSKSSASVFLPSSVSNSYPFSTGTQGSSRRFSVAFRPSSACSASSLASSSRAACHSSRVPTVCSVMGVASCRGLRQQRPARGAKLIGDIYHLAAAPNSVLLGVHSLADVLRGLELVDLLDADVGLHAIWTTRWHAHHTGSGPWARTTRAGPRTVNAPTG